MILSIGFQLRLFLLMIITGFVIGFVYDILRIIRRIIKHGKFIANIQDIIYWVIVTIFVFYIIFTYNNGEIRFYSILGVFLGMIFYFLLVSPLVLKIAMTVIDFLAKVIKTAVKIILFPLKVIVKILKIPAKHILSFAKWAKNVTKKHLQKYERYAKIKKRKLKNSIRVILKKT
ncbi:spore cortex biosynthesis protein YabQ [Anaeropeptidivorans aminofermentans]|jgi:spore cortex biosynthesis protein YabQ|uniref:spore cortex biosynthesis protein YabQ n=1 Tax=Anaeropeptidivorans aminofermentans TaxID=2934315 RepID=UPI003010B52A|nr:spore cortex biosynthesis protein YabQ [Lachnospiraceae bacterium]